MAADPRHEGVASKSEPTVGHGLRQSHAGAWPPIPRARECLRIEADTSLPGMRVIRVDEQLADTQDLPEEIDVDDGPEFVCQSVRSWCEKHHVPLRYIDAGRPTQGGHIESCNGRFTPIGSRL